ncbi:AAA domain-containing protein [Halovivax gelatinilyticus]|uniref:AAA domain-containing protein n=1 Tax=Halovivax gelatinilyticus TaxID=2961597 RepID=UPI0020CA371C|nr:AAA domain-containing protein [Halovivax gelatinilyticus]
MRDPDAKDEVEKELLAEFIDKLEAAIGRVRPDLSNEGLRSEEGLFHMYPYSERQREWLVDATRRHEGDPVADAVRTLLGYRQDIDQEIVSVLREEFRARHAFRYPGLGLFQTVAQFYDISKERDFGWEDVRDETETPLKRVFDLGFFEVALPIEEFADRVFPNSDNGLVVPPDRFHGHYPVIERHRDTMPLEYLYAAEEFDVLDEDWASDEAAVAEIVRYRHHEGDDSPRVCLSDIEDLIHTICNAFEYIERCIRYKNAGVTKEPINLESLTANSLGESALQRTLVEYQQLEHGSKRRALEYRYRQPLAERVAAGQTIPFEVTNPPENRENFEKKNTVEGEILRRLGDGQPGMTATTTLRRESGNWVVLTPLVEDDDGRLIEKPDDPTKYANGVLGRLGHINTDRGQVKISFPTDSNRRAVPNMTNHVGWTSDPDDERQLIAEGMTFAVNEALDDYSAYRAREAIDNANENVLHNELLDVYAEENPTALQFDEPFRNPDAVEGFLRQFDAAMPYESNCAQREFVRQLNHSVGTVQGPPGTGKTAYASTPAILSRVATTPDDEPFIGVVSAHSNTAVDEVARAVGDATMRLAASGAGRDVTLIRVRASSAGLTDLPDNVHDLQYYEDSEELEELLAEPLSDGCEKVVVFATPVTLRNMVNTVAGQISADSNVSDLLKSGEAAIFDYALVDEASMMDLPLLFLVGAFLREGSQIQLVGDHRQMQPIHSHDWESEDRATIEEHTPAVSALDFIRFLRGETNRDLATVERKPPEWDDPDQVIPMERLTITYRLPPAMAEFETDLFYYRDGIELTSHAEARRIPDVRTSAMPAWLREALDPEPRVTLLLHDDQRFTKDSPVEAYLAKKLLSTLPVVAADPGERQCSAGVVVPFRLMRRRISDQEIGVPVDTVERYQGDEKDVMVLAMTAGNQGYVNGLAEFLLDANRFNVGASRMKRKLFIVASKSIFRAVAPDVDEYEDQKAWKQLYRRLGVADRPNPPTATLTKSQIGELDPGEEVTVEVYTGFRD